MREITTEAGEDSVTRDRVGMEPSKNYQTTVDTDTFHPREADQADVARVSSHLSPSPPIPIEPHLTETLRNSLIAGCARWRGPTRTQRRRRERPQAGHQQRRVHRDGRHGPGRGQRRRVAVKDRQLADAHGQGKRSDAAEDSKAEQRTAGQTQRSRQGERPLALD